MISDLAVAFDHALFEIEEPFIPTHCARFHREGFKRANAPSIPYRYASHRQTPLVAFERIDQTRALRQGNTPEIEQS